MSEPILLVGGGGHAKVIIDSILSDGMFEIVGILDCEDKVGQMVNGIPIIDTDEKMSYYYQQGINNAFISMGSVGIPSLRSKLYNQIEEIGFTLVNIIDSSAMIAHSVKMGRGNYIGKGVIVNSSCEVGNGCILNTRCTVEHDCVIGDFVHLSPASTLCGGVKIGSYTHIGAGSVIIEQRQIGSFTIIGAGSTVVKNIDSKVKAYGNPCRTVEPIREHR